MLGISVFWPQVSLYFLTTNIIYTRIFKIKSVFLFFSHFLVTCQVSICTGNKLGIIHLVHSQISYPMTGKRRCAYQGVRNVSFSDNSVYIRNEWSPLTNKFTAWSHQRFELSSFQKNFRFDDRTFGKWGDMVE